jgi:hypothetical protein
MSSMSFESFNRNEVSNNIFFISLKGIQSN